MKKFFCIFLLVALNVAYAQERPSYFIKDSLCEGFTLDTQGYFYLWHDSMLDKFAPAGEHIFSYSNPSLGHISTVDAVNPLKTMLFFQESGEILFLDNKLAPLGNPLNLFANNFNNVTLAAFATTNRLVLFDQSNQDLIITDLSLNVISKTHLTFDEFTPTQLQVCNEKDIVLNNPSDGIYFFDKFGTFDKKIDLPNIRYLYLNSQLDLFHIIQNSLFSYNMKELKLTLIYSNIVGLKQFYPKREENFSSSNSSYFYFMDRTGIFSISTSDQDNLQR